MRVWTVDEARAALPRVRAVVERIRELVEAARARSAPGSAKPSTNGHGAVREPGDRELHECSEELHREGIVLRDPERGLLDFPAVAPSGRPYWICWLAGESDIGWWHWPEDGFAGRRPLTDPPD